MKGQDEGFFLSYPVSIQATDEIVTFSYYHLERKKKWRTTFLFNFNVPANYLKATSEVRIYESIIPFLPRYWKEGLYYIDYNLARNSCNFFSFCLQTQQKNFVSHFSFSKGAITLFARLVKN